MNTATLWEDQQQLVFFNKDGPPPSREARLNVLNPSNPMSPYFGMVGNRRAVNRLIKVDFNALGKFNHDASALNIALFGRTGSGKTELFRRHFKANRLPVVEINPKSIRRLHDIYLAISRECDRAGIPLVPLDREDNFVCPPINVGIDEVHALADGVVQGLLMPTEKKDGMLRTEMGVTLNCKLVHWVVATTERGRLPEAFDTRFAKIQLSYYTKDEVAQIVSFNFPEIPTDACLLAAHFVSKIPRETLAFAAEMQMEHGMNPGDWKQAARSVAEEHGIDEFGMSEQCRKVLIALADGPVASQRLPYSVGCQQEELERFTLPWLMEATEDQGTLIKTTNKGYTLTEAGLEELNKRKIDNKGKDALAA
jgi:hypothetical protein